jgi:hypothetical protein
METWEFIMNQQRDWEWLTRDSQTRAELRRSTASFKTLADCVDDAGLYGYERRSDGRRKGDPGGS